MKVNHLNRREVLTLLGGAAAWPVAARAQQTAMPVIGFLNAQSAARFTPLVDGFRRGLGEVGYVESQNVAIEYRWAEGQYDRLPALADDLVRRRVAVIVAAGGAHLAAKAATTTIPLVVSTGGDPIKQGLIASLNRPGGNLTGATVFNAILEAKRFELLHALVPNADLIGALLDLRFSITEDQVEELEKAARVLAKRLRVMPASTESDLEPAFSAFAEARAGGVVVAAGPFNLRMHAQIVALARRYALPAVYENRESVLAGGLISYGTNISDIYRQLGIYAGRILKGEKPADLPFVQPAKFDMAINLRTAKALGLSMPPTLLARADEVIE